MNRAEKTLLMALSAAMMLLGLAGLAYPGLIGWELRSSLLGLLGLKPPAVSAALVLFGVGVTVLLRFVLSDIQTRTERWHTAQH